MTLRKWKEEAKTKKYEEAAFNKRRELITCKQYSVIGDRTFLVPRNEAELYGIFISLYTLYPDEFEPPDYDESAGIDLLARNKTGNKIADCEFGDVELKYQFGATEFNHSYSNIRYIVCWELSSKVKDGSVLKTSVEDETRILHIIPGIDGDIKKCYLDSDNAAIKISGYVVIYRSKDKNTTQGNLAELVGSPVTPAYGVSSPPSLGSSVLCLLQSL